MSFSLKGFDFYSIFHETRHTPVDISISARIEIRDNAYTVVAEGLGPKTLCINYRSATSQASRSRSASRAYSSSSRSTLSSLAEDDRIEFANLQIGFQLAYYRVRLFRLKAGGKGINVDTPRKAGGLLQRLVSHCLRCCSLLCIRSPSFPSSLPHPAVSFIRFCFLYIEEENTR